MDWFIPFLFSQCVKVDYGCKFYDASDKCRLSPGVAVFAVADIWKFDATVNIEQVNAEVLWLINRSDNVSVNAGADDDRPIQIIWLWPGA